MNKLFSSRERIIFIVTASVVVFFVFFHFFFLPVFEKNSALDKEIRLTLSKYKKYQRLISQKDRIRSQAELFPFLFKKTSKGTGVQESALFGLQNLAKNANLELLDIRPQSAKGASSSNETTVDLKTEGSPLAFLKFFYDIETSASLFEIKSFLLKSKFNSPFLEGTFSVSELQL
jgi:hypothetical protein